MGNSGIRGSSGRTFTVVLSRGTIAVRSLGALTAFTAVTGLAALTLAACGGSALPPKTQEMVPANSANEPGSSDGNTSAAGAQSEDGADDTGGAGAGGAAGKGGATGTAAGAKGAVGPNSGKNGGGAANGSSPQPMPQKIGGDESAGTSPAATPLAAPVTHAAPGPKATKAECKKVFDKYIDLAVASDPRLSDLPPDVIKEAFAQAAAQSQNPCDGEGISRNQYKCAMKAASTDAWQACMK